MTAVRVVELHSELIDVPSGSLSHPRIDDALTGSAFILVTSGSTDLTSARVFSAGPGITVSDGGPGGVFAVSASAASKEMIWNEAPSGTMDGTNRSFSLLYTPNDRKLLFFRNGVLLASGSTFDYVQSGSSVVLNPDVHPPKHNEVLLATYERTL